MSKKAYAQVYSLIRQDRNPQHLYDALKTFSDLGYDGVEGIGANSAGLSVPDFKKYLADLGLDMCSVMNVNSPEEWQFAAEVGARHIVTGYNCHSHKREDIVKACDECNKISREVAKFGLKNLIHNHATEFEWVEGEEGKTRVYDLMLASTDPEFLNFEIDVGWVQFGGADPVEYIKNYSGRFPIIHVKECNRVAKDDVEREHFPKKVLEMGPPKFVDGTPFFKPEQEALMYNARNFNVELGKGIIDWKSLAAAADAQNVPVYYVSEREYYHCYDADGDEKICAKHDCEFIHAL